MKKLNNSPKEPYENAEAAVSCLRLRLEYSVRSYETIQPLCNYPPIKNILTETLQERKRFFYLLNLEICSMNKRSINQTGGLPDIGQSFQQLDEFDLQTCDQKLIEDMRVILSVFDLPKSLNKLIAIYYNKFELHLIKMHRAIVI